MLLAYDLLNEFNKMIDFLLFMVEFGVGMIKILIRMILLKNADQRLDHDFRRYDKLIRIE